MKELSIKEKAKRYDEAIKKAKNCLKDGTITNTAISYIGTIFPELKESEDEKIRKELIDFIYDKTDTYELREKSNSWLAWLEKQGEQKQELLTKEKALKNSPFVEQKPADKIEPKFKVGDFIQKKDDNSIRYSIINRTDDTYRALRGLSETIAIWFSEQDQWELVNLVEQNPAWSEEDETTKNNISHIIRQYDKISKRKNQPCYYVGDCLLWMQNIKGRVLPQPMQEWSEEDKMHVHSIISTIECCRKENERSEVIADAYTSDLEWFKSLMNRCKPSEDLPHWKKGTLKGKNVTGFNSDFFSHNGYYINYNELFDKLPKDE